jgi:fructose-bisphosphate aldolase class I
VRPAAVRDALERADLADTEREVSTVDELYETAMALVAPGKGILAADESDGTIKKRFDAVGVASTEENRRTYRETLFRTPGLGRFISGVILFDETVRQRSGEGVPLVEVLRSQGIIPGIKVDRGAEPLAFAGGETVTEGLDGLRGRFEEYRLLGARFGKWRATYSIGPGRPSADCVRANAHALARYAALCQEAGLVPIVEPEVLMDGPHSIEDSAEATARVLAAVYDELYAQRVDLRATLLKPNMVLSGYAAPEQAGPERVAEATLDVLYRHVPAAVPGMVFLSGGQSDEDATAHLSAMNALGPHPWQLSFSFGRALQSPALHAWAGRDQNLAAAQRALYRRAEMNSAARSGTYSPAMERESAAL